MYCNTLAYLQCITISMVPRDYCVSAFFNIWPCLYDRNVTESKAAVMTAYE